MTVMTKDVARQRVCSEWVGYLKYQPRQCSPPKNDAEEGEDNHSRPTIAVRDGSEEGWDMRSTRTNDTYGDNAEDGSEYERNEEENTEDWDEEGREEEKKEEEGRTTKNLF